MVVICWMVGSGTFWFEDCICDGLELRKDILYREVKTRGEYGLTKVSVVLCSLSIYGICLRRPSNSIN